MTLRSRPRATLLVLASAVLCLAAAAPASAARPDAFLFSAKRGTFRLAHGTVTLRLRGTRGARQISTVPLRPLRRRLDPREVAARAHPGSLLTVEVYDGRSHADSLTLRVRRVRASGGRMLVEGRRLPPGRSVRLRQSFNTPDRRLPHHLRAIALTLDTRPGGPELSGPGGVRSRGVVMAIGYPRRPAARALKESYSVGVAPPGDLEVLLDTLVRTANFRCELWTRSSKPVTVTVESNLDGGLAHPGDRFQAPANGEAIEIDSGLGENAPELSTFGAEFSVFAHYDSEALVRFGVRVGSPPPESTGDAAVEAVCVGEVEGGEGSGFGTVEGGEFP
jgi:hypothetical protein